MKYLSYGDVYVVTNGPYNVDKLDNGFRLHGGGGVYLATTGADIGSDPFMYWQTNLADNVWSYDVDVSNVGCKCNAAMYWVNMPGDPLECLTPVHVSIEIKTKHHRI